MTLPLASYAPKFPSQAAFACAPRPCVYWHDRGDIRAALWAPHLLAGGGDVQQEGVPYPGPQEQEAGAQAAAAGGPGRVVGPLQLHAAHTAGCDFQIQQHCAPGSHS